MTDLLDLLDLLPEPDRQPEGEGLARAGDVEGRAWREGR